MKKRLVALISALILLTINIYAAIGKCEFIEIKGENFVVDTFLGVDAVYKEGGVNGSDIIYNCAAYIKKFYSTIYAFNVYNLYQGQVPLCDKDVFVETDFPSPGDIMAENDGSHFAIVKKSDENGVTLIEQNYYTKDKTKGAKNRVVLKEEYEEGKIKFYTLKSKNPITKMIDITSDFWGYKAIEKCMQDNIFKGKGENYFGINENMTRAQFAQMIYNYYSVFEKTSEDSENKIIFSDVTKEDWFYDGVMFCAENEIVFGDGEKFDPNKEIKREGAALILVRILLSNDEIQSIDEKKLLNELKNNGFEIKDTDDISDYAKKGVIFALGNIINGDEQGYLNPKNPITRAQCAQLMYNFVY